MIRPVVAAHSVEFGVVAAMQKKVRERVPVDVVDIVLDRSPEEVA